MAGPQEVILYENEEFYLELAAGEAEGIYKIDRDTIFLEYKNKPENWPEKLSITDEYFTTISKNSVIGPFRIKRLH